MNKKWVFLGLWFLCVVVFSIGQLLAPPEYYLIPNNPWGNLFGASVVLGIIFFVLAVISFAKDFLNRKKECNRVSEKNAKYDFSIKRVFSRVVLTGVVGIIFGVAMFPFLQDASGLLYEQRAAIGGQNIVKMVVLWGIFTLIVSLYAFWKKHFRMVSISLIICWIIGISFLLIVNMYGANSYRCNKANPYSMPSEFNRALDLISQRTGVDSFGSNTILQTIFNFRNCLDIQYASNDNGEVEAYFEWPPEKSQSNLQDLKIIVNPSYKNFDDLTLATLLSHEIDHVGQYINEVVTKESISCYEKEAKAFTAQHAFFLSLNQEEQRSIYARLRDDTGKNPAIATFLLTEEMGNDATQACAELQKKNNLSNEQMIKCAWEGLENKLLEDLQKDPYYQRQCLER